MRPSDEPQSPRHQRPATRHRSNALPGQTRPGRFDLGIL